MTAPSFFRVCSSLLLALLVMAGGKASSQQSGGSVAAPRTARGATNKAAADSAADAPSPFHITGRVINSLSNAPVARAEITVSPMGARRSNGRFAGRPSGQTTQTVADAEGRFTVEVPSAGGWSLSVSAHGYHTQAFEEHGGYSTAVILTDAKPMYDLTFRLTPGGGIEGYVLDEAGEAVRNAQVTLSLLPSATPEDQHPRQQNRGSQRTDDRGYYRFSGLLSGNYDVRLQAQPWYATNAGVGARLGGGIIALGGGAGSRDTGASTAGSDNSAPDPLDVVYPMVWFPGVTDFAAATPIMLHGGETREANFRLSPIAGFHLHVAASTQPGDGEERRVGGDFFPRGGAYLSQVLPDGTESGAPLPMRMDANGATEFSGLAPGTYVIHRPGESEASAATIRIAENSAHSVDASQATPAVDVTVKVDAAADMPSLQISFRDVESGHVSFLAGLREPGTGRPRRGRPVAEGAPAAVKGEDGSGGADRSISLQPGRYEVVLNGINDLHLTSIEAKGATATGRTVTITGGAPALMLHVATGRANVTGVVTLHGRPLQAAMVLLVPATLGDPAGLNVARRDQSNTDGSFDMTNVLPGAYILVAIDHGWDVNWSDPAMLRRFLIHGVPLDLTAPGERKETIEAQSP